MGGASSTQRVTDAARLEARFQVLSGDRVEVRYRLHNRGNATLAVFDRGDRHAVLTGRLIAGATGAPTWEEVAGGDVVLRHMASVAPAGPTGPTVPRTPLALALPAGQTLSGSFIASIPGTPPTRLRWCLGVAPFDAAGFFSPEQVAAGEIWQAQDDAIARQALLCTPWFAMATGRFEGV